MQVNKIFYTNKNTCGYYESINNGDEHKKLFIDIADEEITIHVANNYFTVAANDLLDYLSQIIANRHEVLVRQGRSLPGVACGNYKQIRFYCKECGKELFEDMDLEDPIHLRNTIEGMLFYTNECTDCSMRKIRDSKPSA